MTRVTTKCFSRLRGFTAVHFVNKSFFGLSGFFRARRPGADDTPPALSVGYRVMNAEVAAPVLVGFDVSQERVSFVRMRCSMFGLEDFLQPLEGALQVLVAVDRLDGH